MNPGLLSAVEKVDRTFLLIFGLSFAILAAITAIMLYFCVRYRHSRHPVPVPIAGNWQLEVIWTLIPTVIVMMLFGYGWDSYLALRNGPADAMQVTVEARQYSWSFQYANGRTEENLIVATGRPVQLTLTSRDVIHGLFLPAYRLKRDAVPGLQSRAWFTPGAEGSFEIFCSQYCGSKHFAMRAEAVIVSDTLFTSWYTGKITATELMSDARNREWASTPPGLRVLKRHGCLNCHSLDGSRDVGPTFKDLFGREITVERAGNRVNLTADTGYIARAITDPQADIVAGFDPLMSSYELRPEEMAELLAYFKERGAP